MVDYKWDAKGFWSYERVNKEETLYVPLPDGSSVEIEQLSLIYGRVPLVNVKISWR